ncbi:Ldh family oxidoreductase [Fontivita pretiosa]|uniref:Ldh family oxidoreductase n=1 Tax=Fontivita pretiosa TaxID=2989684 RepID=UPI003D1849BC
MTTASSDSIRVRPEAFSAFAVAVFTKLGVPQSVAQLAARSMLDASLLGVDTHGIESMEMYVNHLLGGGLKADREPVLLGGSKVFERWDMRSGFGLASARILMQHAIQRAGEHGLYLATVRNTNHVGACGVYGKIAADQGYIGMISQQSFPCLAPWGGREIRLGSSPFAFVAPVQGMFPFYFDCHMAMMTRAQVKAHRLAKKPLPEGVAMDKDGNPTTDPEAAWFGQLMPIGKHKGVGLAMVFEILSAILSGNRFSNDIPSIVNEPNKSADSSFFIMAIDPGTVAPQGEFARRMREYVEYIESSPPLDPNNPPRYPGRREGQLWEQRSRDGIPVSPEGRAKFDAIVRKVNVKPLV